MTVLDPQPGLDVEPGGGDFADLAADCAEVSRHLAEVPPARHRLVTIPAQAVAIVSDLDTYGD